METWTIIPAFIFLSIFFFFAYLGSTVFKIKIASISEKGEQKFFGENRLFERLGALNEKILPDSYKNYASKKIEEASLENRICFKKLMIIQELCSLAILLLFIALAGPKAFKASFILYSASLGFLVPLLMISRKAKKHNLSINESIPFFSDILTLSCEAGLDIFAAMINFIENTENSPLKETIEAILKEVRLGKSRQDALREAYQKTDIWDLKTIYLTIIQSEALGTPIGRSLRNQVQTMRNNRMNRAERLAQEAPLKLMIPLLFFIFPVTFTVILSPIILRFIGGEMF